MYDLSDGTSQMSGAALAELQQHLPANSIPEMLEQAILLAAAGCVSGFASQIRLSKSMTSVSKRAILRLRTAVKTCTPCTRRCRSRPRFVGSSFWWLMLQA